MSFTSICKEINDLADLQNQVYDLYHSDLEIVHKSIKESDLIKTKSSFKEILLTIKNSIESRPKIYHDQYYLLIKALKPDIQEFFTSDELCFQIFTINEIRLKLITFELIEVKDIVFLIKSHKPGRRRDILIKTFSEHIQPYLSEIQNEEEGCETDQPLDDRDPNYRIPFLSNRASNDINQDEEIIINLLQKKVPLTDEEKYDLLTMIEKTIVNDDIDTFQHIVSSTNIFINQEISKLDFTTVGIQSNCLTLIDFAALNSSIQIFKFLILDPNVIVDEQTVCAAIGGGNYDILHIIESRNKELFSDNSYVKLYMETAISRNQNQTLDYLCENYDYDIFDAKLIQDNFLKAIEFFNYDVFYRILTHFENESESDDEIEVNVEFVRKLVKRDEKTAENLVKRVIRNGAYLMFVALARTTGDRFRWKVCHSAMKTAFECGNKDAIVYMLIKDRIKKLEIKEEPELLRYLPQGIVIPNLNQNQNQDLDHDQDLNLNEGSGSGGDEEGGLDEGGAVSNFDWNFPVYEADLNFIVAADARNLGSILFVLQLVTDNASSSNNSKSHFFNQTDFSGQTLLHIAARNDWTAIIDFYLSNADMHDTGLASKSDIRKNTPLHTAVEGHSTKFVKALISHKEKIFDTKSSTFSEIINSVNYEGLTPFLEAVERGYLDLVEFLSSMGEVNLNARNDQNQNALQISVKNHLNKVFKFLISNVKLVTSSNTEDDQLLRAINFSNKDVNGQNLLHLATYEGNLEIVKEIIQLKTVFKPSLLNEKDNENHTSLHFAAYSGNSEIVDILLHFLDALEVDAKGIEEETPLHWAAENGFIDIVKLLCEKGHADVGVVDINGKTPKQRAEDHEHDDVVEYLNQFERK